MRCPEDWNFWWGARCRGDEDGVEFLICYILLLKRNWINTTYKNFCYVGENPGSSELRAGLSREENVSEFLFATSYYVNATE